MLAIDDELRILWRTSVGEIGNPNGKISATDARRWSRAMKFQSQRTFCSGIFFLYHCPKVLNQTV